MCIFYIDFNIKRDLVLRIASSLWEPDTLNWKYLFSMKSGARFLELPAYFLRSFLVGHVKPSKSFFFFFSFIHVVT